MTRTISHWIIAILAISATIYAPILLTRPASSERFNFTDTGNIGNTIGGLTTPVVSLIAVFVVYMTFREQVKTNQHIAFQELTKHIRQLEKANLTSIQNEFQNAWPIIVTEGGPQEEIVIILDQIQYFFERFKIVKDHLGVPNKSNRLTYESAQLLYAHKFRTNITALHQKMINYERIPKSNIQAEFPYASQMTNITALIDELSRYFKALDIRRFSDPFS